ncbi:trace amine-associated receptor 13c-like [Oculina patagonica]
MKNYTNDNASSEGSHASRVETTVIINCAIIAPLILISIAGNSLVLAAIKRTSSLRSPSIIFIGSLAISDLVVGFIVQPLFIARELTNLDLVKYVLETTAYGACGFSLFIMTAISVDRFVALHYHMRYPSINLPNCSPSSNSDSYFTTSS